MVHFLGVPPWCRERSVSDEATARTTSTQSALERTQELIGWWIRAIIIDNSVVVPPNFNRWIIYDSVILLLNIYLMQMNSVQKRTLLFEIKWTQKSKGSVFSLMKLKLIRGMSQLVECFPGMCEALGLIPSQFESKVESTLESGETGSWLDAYVFHSGWNCFTEPC